MTIKTLTPTTLTRLALAALLAVVVLVVAAQSGDAASTHRLAVGAGGDDRMGRASGTIVAGDTVVFAWEDGGHDLIVAGPEGTRVSEQDEGFRLTRKIDRPGSYSFMCSLHDDMQGSFTVAESPSGPVEGADTPAAQETDVVVAPDGDPGVDPAAVTVQQGQTVNWHWGDDGISLTFDDGAQSGSRSTGQLYGRTFNQVGEYGYRTSEGATGTVTVVEPGADSGSGIRPAPAGATANQTVTVANNSFSPSAVTVDEGGVVQWNWSAAGHNVRFDDGTDSGFKSAGATYALKFYNPGTYSYVCQAHSGMAGSVTVNDTGAPGPNEEAPAGGGNPGGGDTGTGGGDTGTGGGEPTTPVASDVAVGGASNAFTPATVNIQTGQTVKWTWAGGFHNVAFADGVSSGAAKSSGTWFRRFLNPGDYAYICDLHPEMQGRVVVTGEPVPDDGTPTTGGSAGGGGGGGGAGTDQERGSSATSDGAQRDTGSGQDAGAAGGGSAGGSDTAAVAAAPADAVRPAMQSLRTVLRRGRGAHAMRIAVTEDAMLEVTMRALGRSRDLVKKRTFKLFVRKGQGQVRLPVMNLTAKRYSLRIVAVDQAGNRSPVRKLVVKLGR